MFAATRGQGHFLRAWLDCRAPSATGAPHRQGRSRAREPWLRPYPRPQVHTGAVPRGRRANEGYPRGHRRGRRCVATARQATPSTRRTSGRSTCCRKRGTSTVRASTRFATTCTACPTHRGFRSGSGRTAILEIPVTTVRMGGRNYPCGGGGYFRLLPYGAFRWMLARVNEQDRQSGLFYFHPVGGRSRAAARGGRAAQVAVPALPESRFDGTRLERLLGDFTWGRMDEVFGI